jgi:hypothetical protein
MIAAAIELRRRLLNEKSDDVSRDLREAAGMTTKES